MAQRPKDFIFAGITVLFALSAIALASLVIIHAQRSTHAIEQVLEHYNLRNEGAKTLKEFSDHHPVLGFLIGSPVKDELDLPSIDQAEQALYGDVKRLLKTVREESCVTAWASWLLLNGSLIYAVTAIGRSRSFTGRPVLVALTCISASFFLIGVLAPAMVIWTTPSIPMESGKLEFVLQHEVRGIAAIIWELLTNGHWIVGGFLLLFSILTPITKIVLTFYVAMSTSEKRNSQIGRLLHSIGKWSMADVFVAGILLSLYALKAQEATKSIPCLGLYYFMGYCLLSMITTELLVHSRVVGARGWQLSDSSFPPGRAALVAFGIMCFTFGSAIYTYDQYTMNVGKEVHPSASPQKLDNRDLVLPIHK